MSVVGKRAEVLALAPWGRLADRVPVIILRETDTRFLVRVIATVGRGRWAPGNDTWVRKGQTIIVGQPLPAEARL